MKLRLIALVAALVLAPALSFAQDKPLPTRVKQIVQALYDRNVALSEGNDDQRRALTKMIAEQTTCELGEDWGWKSASPTRPPSKDAIAHKIAGGKLDGWDLFNGSTRKPNGGIYHDLTGQHFIAVSKVDHLGVGCLGTPPPPPPPPDDDDDPPAPPTADYAAVLAELKAINAKLDVIIAGQTLEREAVAAAIRDLQAVVAAGVKIRF